MGEEVKRGEPWAYRISAPVVRMALRTASRWRVEGLDNVPRDGPLVVVANHMSNWDPPLLSLSLGRYAVFMGKEELFRYRPLNPFLSGLGIFPVGRGRLDREALRIAERILADGGVLAVFPEGSRSRERRLKPALPGSAMIALRTGVPVLAAAITGTEKIAIGPRSWRRPVVTVRFGSPFRVGDECGSDRRRAADFMMGRVAELLPPGYRGAYADWGWRG